MKCRKISIQVHVHLWPFSSIRHTKDKEAYFLCCDQKAQTASAASNNRPDEITLLLLVHVTYICVLLFAHIPFVVNRTFNAISTERLQQRPLLFAVNHTYRTFFLWRLPLTPPSHPGQSTTLL